MSKKLKTEQPKKPREFELFSSGLSGGSWLVIQSPLTGPDDEYVKVREVIEISEAELKKAAEDKCVESSICDPLQAFDVGARWAIAKLTGGSK